MNDQLPPIDRNLRAHLARRSAGRLPEGLASQVLQAVDHVPVAPRRSWLAFSPRPTAAPRTLLAGGSLAAVLLLVATFVVVPRFQVTPAASGPAGYPADRALTTAELASLMAGPALPANMALVASVTIDAKTDVCPMNRYPTIGVVEGMGSQVCVMGSQVPAYLTTASVTGTFAFRYFGPGYLGLLGEITPASPSKVAFKVADDWPVAGKTFLVDGWLGAVGLTASCASLEPSGDVLNPSGEDCPNDNWLGDQPTAPGIEADHGFYSGSPEPSYDPLSLRGNARHVEAGGMRQIDSIDHAAPVHGVFVVRSVVEGCPGDPPQSSRGCGAWRVLAWVPKVWGIAPVAPAPSASITEGPQTPIPEPTPLPTASALPPAASPVGAPAGASSGLLAPGNRPFTVAELPTLWAADPTHLAGRVVVVKGPVPTGFECSGVSPTDDKASSPACYANIVDGQIALDGYYWAVRVGVDGMLSVIGQLSTPTSGFVLSLDQAWAKWNAAGADKQLFLVDAWIGGAAMDSCDIAGQPCYEVSWLGSTADAWLAPTPNAQQVPVQLGAYHAFGGGSVGGGAAIHGIFLVRWIPTATACGTGDLGTGPCPSHAEIVARMEAATVP